MPSLNKLNAEANKFDGRDKQELGEDKWLIIWKNHKKNLSLQWSKKEKDMETMTREEALQRLHNAKQVKKNLVDKLTKIAVEEYEKSNGAKPTCIEVLWNLMLTR